MRPESRYTFALALAACVAYAAINQSLIADIVNDPARSVAKTVLYAGWTFCGFLTFAGLMLAARPRVLWPLAALMFVSLTVNFAYPAIAHVPLTVDVIEWLPHELSQLFNASSEYTPEIAGAILRAAGLVGVFLVLRRWAHARPGPAQRLATHPRAPLISTLAFLGFHVAGGWLQPPNSVAETNLYLFGIPSLLAERPDPQPVPVRVARPAAVEKVVVVIDESVTREAYEKLAAPYVSGLPVRDFGEAASTTNCSAPGNALLRWGVELPRLKQPAYDPRTNPTIWAYARAAGYATVLIDGQSKGEKQNFLSPEELELIDAFVPAQRDEDTDWALADSLNERLRAPGRAFIVVVKKGSHFPYEMNYPRGATGEHASRSEKYAAAVSHTTGAFFERIARNLAFDRILMIYTSDHGQDLSMRAPHCNSDPAADEYSVPLLAITASPALASMLDGNRMFDRASHLNIFSTVLDTFGYDRQWIHTTYGPTLAGPPASYLTYVNLGWQGQHRGERHTVRPSDFVESATFPKRAPGEKRRAALEGVEPMRRAIH